MIDFSFCPHYTKKNYTYTIHRDKCFNVQASKIHKYTCIIVDRSSLNRFENQINFKLFEIQRSNIGFSCNFLFIQFPFFTTPKTRRSWKESAIKQLQWSTNCTCVWNEINVKAIKILPFFVCSCWKICTSSVDWILVWLHFRQFACFNFINSKKDGHSSAQH